MGRQIALLRGINLGPSKRVKMAELRALCERGQRFSLLSEEAGAVDFGAEFPRVLLDPVDGSRNAKRGLPVVGVALAVVGGPTVGETLAGFVLNVVSGERWHAVRGGGAFHEGRPLVPARPAAEGRIEVLGLETSPRSVLAVRPLIERAARLRLLGSIALALAHTAAGGIDVHCSPTPHRLFDVAAGLLMIGEVGGVVTDVEGRSLGGLPADLSTRTTLLGSAHRPLHRLALEALRG
jgi:myo-inositol-1(or 4)-monophosphatase